MTPLPREQFPVVERYRYFDHAGIAPITKAAGDALRWWTDRYERQGSLDYDELESRMDRARQSAAAMCGVPVDDLAFVKNTTEGLGFVASGLQWQPGDRVVVPDREFPSTIYPWLALRDLGVRVDLVTPQGDGGVLTVDAFESVIATGPPPKVVATSWVHYGRGWRTDLARLAAVCHDYGSLLCVDAMQGVGVIPSDFAAWNVDFAVVGPHKWLCAPRGVGVFYVAPDVRDRLRPLEPGWASVAHRGAWTNLDLVWDDLCEALRGRIAERGGHRRARRIDRRVATRGRRSDLEPRRHAVRPTGRRLARARTRPLPVRSLGRRPIGHRDLHTRRHPYDQTSPTTSSARGSRAHREAAVSGCHHTATSTSRMSTRWLESIGRLATIR